MCTRIAKASIVALGILAGGLPFGPNEFHSQEALAAGDIPDPPYQMRGIQAIMVGATFDENAVRALLPADIKPSEGITGGFNVYQVQDGYGLGPYQTTYVWVDIEGYNSADGTKGRWILTAFTGPNPETSGKLRGLFGWPLENGVNRHENLSDGNKAAIATVAGTDVLKLVITPGTECGTGQGILHYPGKRQESGGIVNSMIPWVGEFCGGTPVSVDISAPDGHPLSTLSPTTLTWAGEFKDGSISYSQPLE